MRQSLQNEEWRPVTISPYNLTHKVSNQGRVMKVAGRNAGYMLKPLHSTNLRKRRGNKVIRKIPKQRHVVLTTEGQRKFMLINRLVALAFVPCSGNPDDMFATYIDSDFTNNYATNLRWVPKAEALKTLPERGRKHITKEIMPSTVTDEQTIKILEMLKDVNLSQRDIAKKIGLSKNIVHSIWVNSDQKPKRRRYMTFGTKNSKAKLTDTDIPKIKERYAKGNITQTQLGLEFNVTQGVIGKIVNNKAWTHVAV